MKENQIIGIILFIAAVSDFIIYHLFIEPKIKTEQVKKAVQYTVYFSIAIVIALAFYFYSK